jgi:hypothetical protein
MILERQQRAGWGAKVIDRLAADLNEAFPDMRGFSPRNLKYMRAFAAAWPDRAMVQQVAARIPYALRELRKPIGVAGWETRIVEKLPAHLKGSLPTVEEIEAELDPGGTERRFSSPRRGTSSSRDRMPKR